MTWQKYALWHVETLEHPDSGGIVEVLAGLAFHASGAVTN